MRRDLLVDNSYKRTMHLSAAIPWGGGGETRGIPGHLHKDFYKYPRPKTKIV